MTILSWEYWPSLLDTDTIFTMNSPVGLGTYGGLAQATFTPFWRGSRRMRWSGMTRSVRKHSDMLVFGDIRKPLTKFIRLPVSDSLGLSSH